MTSRRVAALLRKEWLDLSRNPGALVPVAIVAVLTVALSLGIVFGIPWLTGERFSEDRDMVRLSAAVGAPSTFSDEGRVQYFLLHQSLLLLLLIPITGAMALAAHSVVGEKIAGTLEPLLATPLSTAELLVAKVLGAMLPSAAIAVTCLAAYFAGVAWLAEPGVAAAMFDTRTAIIVLLVGPAATLLSLQAVILVSSRANDPRAAQQVGALVILPLTGLFVAQFISSSWLSTAWLAVIGTLGLVLWLVLVRASVWLFSRETILTRWR
jgi:ABC-2 type transport system permease protein